VEKLQEDAVTKQKVLAQKQQLASEALTRITAAMQQAAERRQEDQTQSYLQIKLCTYLIITSPYVTKY
jgi:hypothetical protein